MATLERMRELKGNPALSLSETFLAAMQEFIVKREKKTKTIYGTVQAPPAGLTQDRPLYDSAIEADQVHGLRELESNDQALRLTEPRRGTGASRSRYIRVQDRRTVPARSRGQCEYVHQLSGRRCESRFGLQYEHILPFAKGGENRARNLRHFWSTHNRLRAIEAYGIEKMRPYLRK